MFWPLVSTAGFVLAVGIVIGLARARTARWERQRAAEDEEVRRLRARERARTARSGLVAASSVARRRPRPGHDGGGGAVYGRSVRPLPTASKVSQDPAEGTSRSTRDGDGPRTVGRLRRRRT